MKKYLILILLIASAACTRHFVITEKPVTADQTNGKPVKTDRTTNLSLVDVGTSANSGTGDPLRTAFIKINVGLSALNTFGILDIVATAEEINLTHSMDLTKLTGLGPGTIEERLNSTTDNATLTGITDINSIRVGGEGSTIIAQIVQTANGLAFLNEAGDTIAVTNPQQSYGYIDDYAVMQADSANGSGADGKWVTGKDFNTTTSSIQTQLDAKINAYYVIEKVASTYYARPSGSYTAYSNADATIVIRAALMQLTSGGTVFIKAGLYDGLDTIHIPHNNITILGAGKYLTKLKLKANADAAGGYGYAGLIQCIGHSYFTIKDIELDVNGANQTLIDNGASVTAKLFGIRIGYAGSTTNNVTIENCHIHNATMNGIQFYLSTNGIVRNCLITDNNWNDISVYKVINMSIDHNQTGGSGDVGISVSGTDITIDHNTIGNLNGTHGSVNSLWSMEVGITGEDLATERVYITNNSFTGADSHRGINTQVVPTNIFISGNIFYGMVHDNCLAINMIASSYVTITNNKIIGLHGNAIQLYGTSYSFIEGNDINVGMDNNALVLDGNSTYNRIIGNNLDSKYGVGITAGSNYNIFISNIFKGQDGEVRDFDDAGTGNVFNSNYKGMGTKWLQETGLQNFALTATSDGLTTGILAVGSQNITVTSANAAYIVCLPTASASTIGMKITGIVTANGCELRVIAAQATTVYINGVTTNVEAAIPANSSFEVTCIDATHWILKVWDAAGAYSAPIPDAV